jgi:hypothetical protein
MGTEKQLTVMTPVVRLSYRFGPREIAIQTGGSSAPLNSYLAGAAGYAAVVGDKLWAPVMEYQERTVPGEPVEPAVGLSWVSEDGSERCIVEVLDQGIVNVAAKQDGVWRIFNSGIVKSWTNYPRSADRVIHEWVPINRVEST